MVWEEICNLMGQYMREESSLFYRKTSLTYDPESHQPWLQLRCREDERLSFVIHSLEMMEDHIYWHGVGMKKLPVKLEGVVHRLHRLGCREIKGKLTVPDYEDKRVLGIYVDNGRVIQTISDKEMQEMMSENLQFIMSTSNGWNPNLAHYR